MRKTYDWLEICHNFANHSVDPIYKYSTFEPGPGQIGIYQWIEENFVNKDTCLAVKANFPPLCYDNQIASTFQVCT